MGREPSTGNPSEPNPGERPGGQRDAAPTQFTDQPDRGRFEVAVDGRVAGFAAYRREPDRMVFTHTEVDPAQRGRGLAGRLAGEALDTARAEGRQVTPLCPYIAEFIRRHQRYLELVDEAHRGELSTGPHP